MATGAGLRSRLKYRFDNYMARGGRSIFVSLLVVFLAAFVLFLAVRGALHLVEDSGEDLGRSGFVTFLQITDPGSMAEDADRGVWFKTLAIVAGSFGIVMLSALIAFITTAVDTRLHELRKGHSEVVERGHTLILGWEEQGITEIIRELVVANESVADRAVVVLADRDKEYMDDYLGRAVPDTRTTRLVTRSGNPSSLLDLGIVSVDTAASVIVLASCSDSAPTAAKAESDAQVVKTVLAARSRRRSGDPLPIVTEVFDPDIRSLLSGIAAGQLVALDVQDVLSRILVQTSRSLGLSVVYDELLSFEGNELYFCEGDWEGLSFGEAAFRFAQAIPIGIRTAAGEILVNPARERRLAGDDSLLVVAEDDSTIRFRHEPVASPTPPRLPAQRSPRARERQLIVGHTEKSPIVLTELGKYVVEGSEVDIMPRGHHPAVGQEIEEIRGRVNGLEVAMLDLDPLRPATWRVAHPADYTSIIILSEGDELCHADQIDAETILILLLIRRALEEAGPGSDTTVVTELIESENQTLADSTGVHDFVISSRLVSMLLAQISEEPEMHRVYQALFSEEGSEVYLKPAPLYLADLPQRVSFADLMAAALERGEVCLGVKLKADEDREDRNYGITLAPDKGREFHLGAEDALVVLAEDES